MSEHTPGPWVVVRGWDGRVWILDTSNGYVAEVGARTTRARTLTALRLDDGTIDANAHLIAAAPDQHKALEKVDRQLENAERRLVGRRPHPNDIEWAKSLIEAARQTAQAAIAKPEGAAVHV